VAFDYLLQSNIPYLKERVSMCNQKARPKEEIFQIKRPQLFTTNKDFYKVNSDKHRLDIEPQNEKMSLLLSPSKVCGNSTTQEFHKGKNGKKADLAQWSEGFKLQGPMFNATTSSVTFLIILERFSQSWRLRKDGPNRSVERTPTWYEAQIIKYKQPVDEGRVRPSCRFGHMEQLKPSGK
jgi:hypothetical protein